MLQHILDNPNKQVSRSPLSLILIAWLLATMALAGPVWRETPQPVHEREDALVIIFDLSRSMLATDVKPDRLVRAKRKLIDLLELRDEGVTALIVFAGDAHTVSPLTDDTNTITAMIPALSPDIVPAPGSRLTSALERAIELFEQASVASGRILIITDEIRDVVSAQRVARAFRNAYPVSVMSVGTTNGAPVPMYAGQPNAGFLKDSSGNLVIPKLDAGSLKSFAELAGGRYSPMSLTDEDLELRVDAEVRLQDVTRKAIMALDTLSPFGQGNPRPRFSATGVELAEAPQTMGEGDRHLRLSLKTSNRPLKAVAFGRGEWAEPIRTAEGPLSICFEPIINRWRGRESTSVSGLPRRAVFRRHRSTTGCWRSSASSSAALSS